MTELQKENDIIILTLKNPPENYLEEPEFIAINDLSSYIKQNHGKALIIQGYGRHFSAGANLNTLKKQIKNTAFEQQLNKGKELLAFIHSLEIPTISAIEGICFGVGFEIALNTHVRIASDKSLFALPEVNHNLIPGLSGTFEISKRLSNSDSITAILGGDIINAGEALNLKLIDKICKPKESLNYTIEYAQNIVNHRPLYIINAVMRCINNTKSKSRNECMRQETKEFIELASKAFND